MNSTWHPALSGAPSSVTAPLTCPRSPLNPSLADDPHPASTTSVIESNRARGNLTKHMRGRTPDGRGKRKKLRGSEAASRRRIGWRQLGRAPSSINKKTCPTGNRRGGQKRKPRRPRSACDRPEPPAASAYPC